MIRQFATLSLCSACMIAAGAAPAQEFPNRAIRMIVPDTPGGGIDTHARVMAPVMSATLGQPVVVENKPGAGYAIGLDYAAKRVPADGYTVAMVFVQGLVGLSLTAKNLSFDPLSDLPPFIGLTESRLVFGSSAKRPWKTMADMVAYAKANPGKLTFGLNSFVTQVVNEAITRGLGFQALMVPYSSGGGIIQAIAAGQLDATFVSFSSARSLGENWRVLAVTGAKRAPEYPDVPTFRELGLDNLQSLSYTVNTAAGVPSAALEKLHAAASHAVRQAEVRARLEKLGVEVVELAPEAARAHLAQQAKFYTDLARAIGIQPQ